MPFAKLKPREAHKSNGLLLLATGGDYITYDISDKDWVNVQLVSADGTAFGAATVTVDAATDGASFANFPAGAETITAFGLNDLIIVTGLSTLRVYVSAAAGTARALVLVTAGVTI